MKKSVQLISIEDTYPCSDERYQDILNISSNSNQITVKHPNDNIES